MRINQFYRYTITSSIIDYCPPQCIHSQRSLARHLSDTYSFEEALSVQREALAAAASVDTKIAVYAELVDTLAMLESYPREDWCDLVEEMESVLHGSNPSFSWSNLDGTLPETVPRGNAIYYALHAAAEECHDNVKAWKYLMKALDMERKGRHMKQGLSTNQYRFEDRMSNFIPVFDYFASMGLRGDPGLVFPIIVMGSSRAAASLVSRILGGHDVIFSLPTEPSRMDHVVGRRFDMDTARGVFSSKVGNLMDKIVAIVQSHSEDFELQKTLLQDTMQRELEILLRYNFGIAQTVRDERGAVRTHYYVEYIGDNPQYLGLLRLLFPSSLILNVVDDPLNSLVDTITERTDQSMEKLFYALHPSQAAKYIAISANTIAFFRKRFDEANPPLAGVKDILFSDVLSDPQTVLQEAVLTPLGLHWDITMLSKNGCRALINKHIRRRGIVRGYMDNGDVSVYQAAMKHYFGEVIMEPGWQRPEFPMSGRINWELGPQVAWNGDGCSPALESSMPTRRDDIGTFLDSLGLTVGAELGVQRGEFANTTLNGWTKCKKYYLIDIWDRQDINYKDSANVDRSIHDQFYQETVNRLAQYKSRTDLVFLRKYTSEAAADLEDNSLDYIYIDARHDYCSVTEDISLYWGKLREGGILAGHDYMLGSTLGEFVEVEFTDRFDICPNGTIRERSVKGAVDDFAASMNLQTAFTFQDRPPFLSFVLRKPCGAGGRHASRHVEL